jgi:hypothetical protein
MKLTEEQINALTGAVTTGVSLVSGLNANKDLYPQCGKRPFFTGKRRDAYDACVAIQPPPINNSGTGNTSGTDNTSGTGGTDNFNPPSADGLKEFFKKYKTPMLIGGGLILAFTIYKISNRK